MHELMQEVIDIFKELLALDSFANILSLFLSVFGVRLGCKFLHLAVSNVSASDFKEVIAKEEMPKYTNDDDVKYGGFFGGNDVEIPEKLYFLESGDI